MKIHIRYSFICPWWKATDLNGQVGGKTITRDFGQGNPFPVPLDDPLHGEVVRVCAPRGSLILWDSRAWAEGMTWPGQVSDPCLPHLPGEGLCL